MRQTSALTGVRVVLGDLRVLGDRVGEVDGARVGIVGNLGEIDGRSEFSITMKLRVDQVLWRGLHLELEVALTLVEPVVDCELSSWKDTKLAWCKGACIHGMVDDQAGGSWEAVGRRTYSGRADTGRTRPPTCLWLSPGMR